MLDIYKRKEADRSQIKRKLTKHSGLFFMATNDFIKIGY